MLLGLWKRRGEARETIRDEIERYLREMDVDAVAGAVQTDLEALSVEDLWDRSGPSHHGYTQPADHTWEMIEEALAPSVRELERYMELGWNEKAFGYCLGMLEGIYAYGTTSESDFRVRAPDDPREAFEWVLRKWKKGRPGDRSRSRMEKELRERCPEWM